MTACFATAVAPSGKVIGIEHISELVERAEENVRKENAVLLDSGILKFVNGDGRDGYTEEGPYDAIHVGAAAEDTPRKVKRFARVFFCR